MTKEEFLDEIKKELGFMPYEEVIKAENILNHISTAVRRTKK